MFDIGWSELVVIAVVAIVVIGPKDLPRVMRLVGQWTGKVKRMGREFQNQFNEALREADLQDVQKDVAAIGKDLREQVTKASADINKGLDVKVPDATAASPGSGAPPPAEALPAPETPPMVEVPPTPATLPRAETPVAAPAPAEAVQVPAQPAAAPAAEVKP